MGDDDDGENDEDDKAMKKGKAYPLRKVDDAGDAYDEGAREMLSQGDRNLPLCDLRQAERKHTVGR